MMCVGLVMAAAHAAAAAGAASAREARARAQGEICLDALSRDPALTDAGLLVLASAREAAAGNTTVAFHPAALRFATLRLAEGGAEAWVVGTLDDLRPGVVVVSRPVPVIADGGRIVPGILRVGVDLS